MANNSKASIFYALAKLLRNLYLIQLLSIVNVVVSVPTALNNEDHLEEENNDGIIKNKSKRSRELIGNDAQINEGSQLQTSKAEALPPCSKIGNDVSNHTRMYVTSSGHFLSAGPSSHVSWFYVRFLGT